MGKEKVKWSYEVDTDGRDVRFGVSIVCESKQQARLSNARVSDKQQLKEIIVSGPDIVSREVEGAGGFLGMIEDGIHH